MSVRAKNFSEIKKALFLGFMKLDRYKSVLESKKTDAYSTSTKNMMWKTLTEEFNSATTEGVREVHHLKAAWKNLKQRAKSSNATLRRSRNETGGGPWPGPETTPMVNCVNGKWYR